MAGGCIDAKARSWNLLIAAAPHIKPWSNTRV
jgi:hypothetical protein